MSEKREGYVLDGIPTAMTLTSPHTVMATFRCPCGAVWSPGPKVGDVVDSARFHFTHCPQAKP